MADIKVMDDDIHKKATGCSNRIILENFAYLAKKGAEVLVRIPIIPGINDSSDNINKYPPAQPGVLHSSGIALFY